MKGYTMFDDEPYFEQNIFELAKLKVQVLSDDSVVDLNLLGPEALKLRERYQAQRVHNFSASLDHSKKFTAEQIAESINKLDDWLNDPYNILISRIGGERFLFEDTLMCMEHRSDALNNFEPVPLSSDEEEHVKTLRKVIELLTEIEQSIQKLKDGKEE